MSIGISEGTPYLPSAQVTLAAGVGGIVPDAGQLVSPFRAPLVIHAVNFMVRYPNADSTSLNIQCGASVRARFRVGNLSLSDAAIPLWVHGTSLPDESAGYVTDAAFIGTNVSMYRWVLPRPLYIPPGSILLPQFQRDADGMPEDMDVLVSYEAAIPLPGAPAPKVMHLPVLALFSPEETTAAASFTSGATELHNPFQDEVHVQRLIGRIRVRNAAPGGGVLANISELVGHLVPGGGLSVAEALVSLRDSLGYDVVKTPTPFADVFDVTRRAWTFERTLEPKEWYRAQVSTPLVDPAHTTAWSVQPHIALIGHREVML